MPQARRVVSTRQAAGGAMKPPNKNVGPTKQKPAPGNPAPSKKRALAEDENSKKGQGSKRPAFGDITNAVSFLGIFLSRYGGI